MVFGCFNSAPDGFLINTLSHDIYHPWKLTFVNPIKPLLLNKIFKRSTWLSFDVLDNNMSCLYIFLKSEYIIFDPYFKSLILENLLHKYNFKIRLASLTYKSSQRKTGPCICTCSSYILRIPSRKFNRQKINQGKYLMSIIMWEFTIN